MLPVVCGIYLIRCLANGCVYVGQAKNCRVRFNHHKHHLRKNRHGNPRLQHAWNAYGEGAFEFVISEECGICELDAREQYNLDAVKSSGVSVFNCGVIAPCPNRGRKLKPLSLEHKDKIRKSLIGHKRSDDERKLISERNKGRCVSEATRAKQRAAKLGKKQTLEHAAKAAAARVAKPRKTSESARQQLIERNKARVYTPEIRAKMSRASRGRAHDEATRAKCSAAAKAYWAQIKLEAVV